VSLNPGLDKRKLAGLNILEILSSSQAERSGAEDCVQSVTGY